MIKEMFKVQIIGPRPVLDEVIRELHSAAVVHIETLPAGGLLEAGFLNRLPMEQDKLMEKEALEKFSERLKTFKALLPARSTGRALRVGVEEIRKYMTELEPFEQRASELRARKDELVDELSVISKYQKLLRGFAPIVTRLGGLKNFDITGLTLEKTREDISGLLEAEVARVTEGMYSVHARDMDEHTLGVVLTYPKSHGPLVRALLAGKAVSEMRLPDEYSDMTLVEALKLMGVRASELPGLINEVDGELYSISTVWYAVATGVARAIENALEEIGVLSFAGATKFAFVMQGWVPADSYAALSDRLSALFQGGIHMRKLEISEDELSRVPVCIKNNRFIRPFEVFLSALSPPRYGSTDPTPFVALFFPVFFGLIVADIGYGGLIFALAMYLRHRAGHKKQFFRDAATVFAVSGLAAVVFGVLFGELFGDLGERAGFLHPIVLNRIEALRTLIALTIAIGAGHVILGVVIAVVSHARRRDIRETGAKAAYLVLIASFIALALAVSGHIPAALIPWSAVAVAASFVGLTILEGVLGPIEFMEALGNIISYVRLMAVGTASVVMALVANRVGDLAGGALLGAVIAGFIHCLNLLLSVMSPSIQSMRLQYVEFFSKFYEGGGRVYRPFKKR